MNSPANTIHAAIELSNSLWLVGTRLPGAARARIDRLIAGDVTGLLALLAGLRSGAADSFGKSAAVACCFEAGRDGFWLHRVLLDHGVESHVVEPTSILVNRRARRAKTDRLDAESNASHPRRLFKRRPAGLQHGSRPIPGGGGRQAAASRA